MSETRPFWQTKPPSEMSSEEWESLCDGCGRCCLMKMRDEDEDAYVISNVACRLLDIKAVRCTEYDTRHDRVPGCAKLTPENVKSFWWLPETCAYRLVCNGEDLPWWHPLKIGIPGMVHLMGISVRDAVISEVEILPLLEALEAQDKESA